MRRNLAALVLLHLALLAAAGIAASIPLAWAAKRGLNPMETLSGNPARMFAGSVFLSLAVCAVAGFLPMRRAVSVDPMSAARAE